MADVVDIVEFFVGFNEHVRGLIPLALEEGKKGGRKGGGERKSEKERREKKAGKIGEKKGKGGS